MNLYNPVFLGPVTLLVGSSDLNLLESIRMNIEELKTQLAALSQKQTEILTVVTKVGAETESLLTKIAELQQAVGNAGELPQEIADAVAALGAQADAVKEALAGVDALVPDAEQPAG